jgi:hypothetical protein
VVQAVEVLTQQEQQVLVEVVVDLTTLTAFKTLLVQAVEQEED